MRGAATETPVVHQKRRGQAQQSLHRKERDLPALLHRTALQQHPELGLRITHRQVQVIRKGGHPAEGSPTLWWPSLPWPLGCPAVIPANWSAPATRLARPGAIGV
jgi:hypothetical protein